MRGWLIFLIALAVLLAGAALAPVFSDHPGYVLIQLGSWTIETTVVVIALAILLSFVVLKVLFWLVDAPRRAVRNLARRRMEQGLLALAEGNWSQAEKALQRAAEPSGLPQAGYLAAARAASSQVDDDSAELRQQQYLEAADNGQARTRFLLELSRARLHLNRNNPELAIPILKRLKRRRRQHPQVLKMLAHCYREQGHWSALQDMLPAMRKAGVINRQGEQDIHRLAASNELQAASSSESLQKTWEKLLRPLRYDPDVVACYAQRALEYGLPRLADNALSAALDKQLDDDLLDLYLQCHLENPEKALSQIEKWRRKEPDNAVIERVLGQLCLQQQLWGKARTHLLESLRLKASEKTYQILGELLERQGEIESALRCYHNALQLSQGKLVKYQEFVTSLNQQPSLQAPEQTRTEALDAPDWGQQLVADQASKKFRAPSSDQEAIGDLVNLPDAYHDSTRSDNDK